MRHVQLFILAVAVELGPAVVIAQDARSEVARRDLLERAEAARSAGDHARALSLARLAAEVRQTPSLRLMLAQEHRVTGQLVEALDNATACVREAEADATLRNRDRLVEVCRTLASEVEPSIGRLTVRVTPASAPGLHVRVGEVDLRASLLGVPSPSMPGHVVVRVEADGFRAVARGIDVVAGHEAQVDVVLDAESSSPRGMGSRVVPSSDSDSSSSEAHGPGAGPWVVVSVGAAGLATGLALFLMSNDARAERDLCTTTSCLSAATGSNGRYEDLLTGANIALGVGGAVATAGLLWWILAPRDGVPPRASVALVPLSGGSVFLVGGRL